MKYSDIFEQARNCISRYTIEALFRSPGAYWDNGEYWTLSPLRSDRTIGSFHINEKGLYIDHNVATGDEGDLIKLVSLVSNISLKDAAKRIIEAAGETVEAYAYVPEKRFDNTQEGQGLFDAVDAPESDNLQAGNFDDKLCKPIIPIPPQALRGLPDVVKRPFYKKKWGEAKRIWQYKNETGGAWCCVVRFEKADGSKDVIPFSLFADGWHAKGAIKANKPLFHLNELFGNPELPVLVVEGEKAASVKVPGYVVVTWMGGATKGVNKADWSPLKDRTVTIWPDNDQAGIIAACNIQDFLPISRILKIEGKPEKWDIADAEADGLDLVEFISTCAAVERVKSEPASDGGESDNSPQVTPSQIVPPSGFIDLSQVEQISSLLHHYLPDMRRNMITETVEYRDNETGLFKPLTDNHAATIQCRLYATGLFKTISQRNFELVMSSDFVPDYDPIKEYFKGLDPWDGKDYIQELANCVEIKQGQFDEGVNSDDMWAMYLKRWLVGVTAQMLDKGKNHICLTLLGPQGAGKTTFLQNMCFDVKYAHVGSINPEDKDSKNLYANKALIVLDELESTTKRDMAALKSNMTLDFINIRLPYGRRSQMMRRMASFCGCANNIDVLGDISGSRRWLCIETGERIDFNKITPEFMRKVYSQCEHLLEVDKFKYWFDMAEIKVLHANNSRFQEANAEQELLHKYFAPCKPDSSGAEWKTTTEILSDISADFKAVKLSMKKLGHLLRHGGFTRIKRKGVYGYYVKDLTLSQGGDTLPLDDPFSDDKIPI